MLGETLFMQAGKAIKSSQISFSESDSAKIKCFGGNGLRGYVGQANEFGDAVLIGRQGAYCGNVNYAEGDFYATEHAVVARPKEEINMRFLYHLLTAAHLEQYRTSGAQPGLSVRRLGRVEIPLPSLEEQQRIGDILDKFDALVNDISQGLPAEIEARRKQYEYYRDKLLTFKKKEN